MKLMISSSSSTLSLDPTLCSSKTAGAGCITTIFHRIFCSSGGLQTHPSDQIREFYSNSIESEKVQKFKSNSNITTITSSPGIVARLMGLDSMAEKENEIAYEAKQSSLSHSRSLKKIMEGQDNKVPDFQLHENENFLVFSFESGGKSKEMKLRGRRKEKSELKKNKREKVYDDEKRKLSKRVSDGEVEFDETLVKDGSEDGRLLEIEKGEKVKRRKKGKTCCVEKKVESECSSEDSSPVSVFDFERQVSGTDIDLFGDGMGWRRKLSSELDNDQHSVLHSDNSLMIEESNVNAIENNVNEGSKKKEKLSQECVDIWGEICKLVEDELVGSNQLLEVKRKQSDFELEEISADFELEIFDHLLDELIDQLVGNPLKALQI